MLFNTLSVQAALFSTMVAATGAMESQKTREHGDESLLPASLGGEYQPNVGVDVDMKGMMESLYPAPIPKKVILPPKIQETNSKKNIYNSQLRHGTEVVELLDHGIFHADTHGEDTGVDADDGQDNYGRALGNEDYCEEGDVPVIVKVYLDEGTSLSDSFTWNIHDSDGQEKGYGYPSCDTVDSGYDDCYTGEYVCVGEGTENTISLESVDGIFSEDFTVILESGYYVLEITSFEEPFETVDETFSLTRFSYTACEAGKIEIEIDAYAESVDWSITDSNGLEIEMGYKETCYDYFVYYYTACIDEGTTHTLKISPPADRANFDEDEVAFVIGTKWESVFDIEGLFFDTVTFSATKPPGAPPTTTSTKHSKSQKKSKTAKRA